MYATRARRRLGVRLAGANGFARGLFRVLALSVVLGSVLTACGSRDPSPSPTSAAPSSVTVKVVDKILIPHAGRIVVDPKAHAVYVSDEEGTLSVIATSTHWAAKSIRLGQAPEALTFDSDAGRLYATFGRGRDFGTVLVIDTHSFEAVDTIRIGKVGSLDGLAVDPPTNRLFVVLDDDELSVIDTDSRTVIRSMSIRKGAAGVAVDSDAGVAYVSGDQQILAIDTKTLDVRDVIDTDMDTPAMTVDSTTGHVFLWDEGGRVAVIDTTTRKVVKTITVGGPYGPFQVVIDPSAGLGYVNGGSGQMISAFDTTTLEVVEEIPRPDGVEWDYWPLAVDPSTGLLYIGSQKSVLVVAKNSPE